MNPFSKIDFDPKIAFTLRHYNRETFVKDIIAGIIVGIIAIPLAIAFGIASGVGATEGLVTAIIAGFIISALGGSRVQIGGPTGAFIVIIYGIIQEFGTGGLAIATIMAGIILVLMGLFKLGAIIKFMPYPIIVGFTAGIAVTIFSTQMNDLFGLGLTDVPADFIEKWICYFKNIEKINWWSLGIGLGSILIIAGTPYISKKLPGSLLAIVIMTALCWTLEYFGINTGVETIGKLPSGLPEFRLPALELTGDNSIWETIQSLLPAAFTIAILGAIESLLSAMVSDGVIGSRHNSNTELMAQGVANIVVPFFGGIPATGAIARTMANINNGGRTPIAGIVHTLVLLLVLLFLGGLVGAIPMPCLAGVLIMVSYNMSGWRTIRSMCRQSRSDIAILFTTMLLTIIFDLTIAIEVGLVLAVVLFVRRIMETSHISVLNKEMELHHDGEDGDVQLAIPQGVEVYEIEGPLFFGVATKFEEMTRATRDSAKVRIIRMRKVSFIDSTGLHNLEIFIESALQNGQKIILSGVNERVYSSIERVGLVAKIGEENVLDHIDKALARAAELAK